ncbi:integrase catalytic domain-containing protein [Trichonephila clavipes]|nr:integrase catalytic domain-containing protein [Trichonephila clavipes]
MGGLWEAGIKSVKYHLKRALGRSRLTYEEFEKVIIQVEGTLNSRPHTPISNDLDNFERGKWMIVKDNVMCGTMVIVKEDFTPVYNWLLRRIVEVYHGSDGKDLQEDGSVAVLSSFLFLAILLLTTSSSGILAAWPCLLFDVGTVVMFSAFTGSNWSSLSCPHLTGSSGLHFCTSS